ncbi:MAG: branched-chain amino acid ABC transporter permease [Frankiales bacterium]|nr:branched-chain amino acid ABC transporter permease [Frankiales bacterium]
MDAGVLLQAALSGLAYGAVLGLVALGFTLVAGSVRVLHLAHGDVVVASVFTAVLAVLGTTPVAVALAPGAAVAFAVLVLLAGAGLSAGVALLAVRPHLPDVATGRSGDALGWVAGGVAAGLLLREVLGLLLPQQGYAVPDPLRLDALTASGVVSLPGGQVLAARVPAVLVIALLAGLAVQRLLARSRFGRALRAVADDPEAAALCGVPARRIVLQAFVLAGLLAGLAGLLDAPGRASLSVDDGVVLGLSGIAAALLGGLGSARGALLGGLAVGLAQAMVVTLLDPRWTDVVPLALLVGLLALRPEGVRRRVVV